MSDPPSTGPFAPGQCPSDDWSCFAGNDVLLVLNTGEESLSLDNLQFKQKTCLIYSENVTLGRDLALPGKNLGIFCCSFQLLSSNATISVSGQSGDPGIPVVEGKPNPGKDGMLAGTIWLYVEEMSESLARSLKLVADGGDGGSGGLTNDLNNPTGGAGGAGQDGGAVNIFYGSAVMSITLKLGSLAKSPWSEQVLQAQNNVVPACVDLNLPALRSHVLSTCKTTLASYKAYADALQLLSTTLDRLSHTDSWIDGPRPAPQTVEAVKACRTAITSVLGSSAAPAKVTSDDTKALDTLCTNICSWMGSGGSKLESQIQTGLAAVTESLTNSTTASSSSSDLQACLSGLGLGLEVALVGLQTAVKGRMGSAKGGYGGPGGASATTSASPGPRGKDGQNGTITTKNLVFDGRAMDIDINQVCAFPDQCQMLLNKADRAFFANSADSIQDAIRYYSRLTRRLSFVPTLTKALQDSSSSLDQPLGQAYLKVEQIGKLTVSSLSQLQSVYVQATGRLNKIALGQDMFSHSPTWVPRLSIGSYRAEVTNQISFLKTLEAASKEYRQALEANANAYEVLNSCRRSNKVAKAQADARIRMLGSPGGILESSANKISCFTPLMAQSRKSIHEKIIRAEWDIKESYNLDPTSLLNAFASVCMAPSDLFAGATGVNEIWKGVTTIPDAQGVPVNKDFVISNLESCSDTLDSLQEAYRTGKGGMIDVDDPKATKILATASDIKKLVTNYKEGIKSADRKALLAELDHFVDLVLERNNAVLAYNAALQMLSDAVEESKYYDKQDQDLGQNLLTLNPYLPRIYYWIQEIVNGTRLAIMQNLNYEARAITFWGLTDLPSFAEPGPLRDSIDLESSQQMLSEAFETSTESFASSLWSTWPTPPRHGLIYQLSENELAAIKTATTDTQDTNIYTAVLSFDENSPLFQGKSNIRLSQVRLWLIGATCTPDAESRQLLTVEIQQMGLETICAPNRKLFHFDHEPVSLQFQYNAADIATIADCTADRIFSTEAIEKDYAGGKWSETTNAPIGPLATWRLYVKESANPGLQMTGVTAAFLEFCGRSMPIT